MTDVSEIFNSVRHSALDIRWKSDQYGLVCGGESHEK